jgi:hypothetical protein
LLLDRKDASAVLAQHETPDTHVVSGVTGHLVESG